MSRYTQSVLRERERHHIERDRKMEIKEFKQTQRGRSQNCQQRKKLSKTQNDTRNKPGKTDMHSLLDQPRNWKAAC